MVRRSSTTLTTFIYLVSPMSLKLLISKSLLNYFITLQHSIFCITQRLPVVAGIGHSHQSVRVEFCGLLVG